MPIVTRTRCLVIAISIAITSFSCKPAIRNRTNEMNLPRVILWAWERPEDLRFLNAGRYGVAVLAQTLVLNGDEVIQKPRRQPLLVPPDAKVVAVTRIESLRSKEQRPTLSANQSAHVTALIRRTLELPNVSAVQVDFDVTTSERQFYRSLLKELRAKLPDETPLSITALASFCIGDRWVKDLPIDEAIPMAFRMGTDSTKIRAMLGDGHDFRGELCTRSYGISLDEPLNVSFDSARRIYVFNPQAWKESDLKQLEERVGK